MPEPVVVIFDVGKTNKKVLLFDQDYDCVQEKSVRLEETEDEDGFPCEDVSELTKWLQQEFEGILLRKDCEVKAANFSAYGASFVHINEEGGPLTPLYNYLKPYPNQLRQRFYETYGGEIRISKETASPALGSLNSGLQLYRLKYERPDVYRQIRFSLHLPQYLSFIVSKQPATDISSVGCHTALWHFKRNSYHHWTESEGILKKFAPLYQGDKFVRSLEDNASIQVGVGLHDSSAALIPYLVTVQDPFVLISTGTWNISLNPFNYTELSEDELKLDCLCYLSYEGKPVKASRLFAGYEHEQQVKRLAHHFNTGVDYYRTIEYNPALDNMIQPEMHHVPFSAVDLNDFRNYEEAYHQLMRALVMQQVKSTSLVLLKGETRKIFVDGGFGKNPVFMHLLAKSFRGTEVFAAAMPQASALGAALAIHKSWNEHPLPANLIELKSYSNPELDYSA